MKQATLIATLILIGRLVFAQAGTLDQAFTDQGISYLNFLSTEEEWLVHSVVDEEDRIWPAGQTFQDDDWKLQIVRIYTDVKNEYELFG